MGQTLPVLEPNASKDRLSVEHYTDSNSECIEALKRTIAKKNVLIKMEDLDVEDTMKKALNSRSAEVFLYEWDHEEGDKLGVLKFFFLRIKNLNEVIGDPTIKMQVDVCFGHR